MTSKLGGCFTISLDFELHWGVLPSYTVEEYKENLQGTPEAIEKSLELFHEYGIHATWATVGFLFHKNKAELQASLPDSRPQYDNPGMNSYLFLDSLDESYDGSFHFAPALIEKIRKTANQEIGTHTFSHYFCLEKGQEPEQFRADLHAAKQTAKSHGIDIRSIVFPRDQFNENYLSICKDMEIYNVRGCPNHYIYKPRERKAEKRIDIRAMRLLDSYFNLTGYNVVDPTISDGIVDIPASRKYRPYLAKLKKLEFFKLERIKKEMTIAAQKKQTYHLWWHPHNLGNHIQENIDQLESIFQHYRDLQAQYGFRSLNMGEIGQFMTEQQ